MTNHKHFGTVHTLFTIYDTVHIHFDIVYAHFGLVHSLFTIYDTVHSHFDIVYTHFAQFTDCSQAMTQFTHTLI